MSLGMYVCIYVCMPETTCFRVLITDARHLWQPGCYSTVSQPFFVLLYMQGHSKSSYAY